MRKIIVLEFVTLDRIIQAPRRTKGGHFRWFQIRWVDRSIFSDDFSGKIMQEQMKQPFDLLLGRKTFDIFASYWPHHASV